ncbi:arsenic transporter [Silvibacterium acidisoli]|uniref:arsenic transporter n=1 Tax=Acidobacteriaceae bacterium ZG23-2 TaxID=2883246 RepID=UPI00406D16CA
MPTAHVLIWTISLASIVCMLVRPRRIPEAVWVSAGALLLVLCRLLPIPAAFHAVAKGGDVYLFLTGMMLLAELARHEGVFDWLAAIALGHAEGSASRFFVLVYVTGVGVTALLSNDATAVVLTPAVLAAVRRAQLKDPRPYLLACAFIANAASFVLPISNPANLVIYGNHIPALGPWMKIFILPSIISIVATYFCIRLLSRSALRETLHRPEEQVPLSPTGRLALFGLALASVALLVASGLGMNLGAPTCAAAAVAVLVVTFKERAAFPRVIRGVSWSVLPLVAGLFVLVEGLNGTGMTALTQRGMQAVLSAGQVTGSLAAAGAVALLSNLMNNLPVGLIAGGALEHAQQAARLVPSVLIGVDLGPNLSVTGSLATILWLIALRRDGVEISGGQFLKAGLLVMPVALVLSVLALVH